MTSCDYCESESVSSLTEERFYSSPEGHRVRYLDAFSRCETCEREFYTPEQSREHSRQIAMALSKLVRAPSPRKIRELRDSLGLTQDDFDKALGLGRKTAVRWERGSVAPSGAAASLLWMIREAPAAFSRLAAQNGVELTPVQACRATYTARTPALAAPTQSWVNANRSALAVRQRPVAAELNLRSSIMTRLSELLIEEEA